MHATAPSVERSRPAWIISPLGDLAFLIAAPLAIVPLLSLLGNRVFSPEQISLAVVSFASIGHHLPGFLRAYADRELFQRYRWRFLLAPPLVLAAAVAFAWRDLHGLSLILLFWATWHVLMQTYGLMRIYDLKQGQDSRAGAWLDFALCLCMFAAGVVFSDARVYGIAEVLWQTGLPAFGAAWLQAARCLIGGATLLVVAAYLVRLVQLRRHGIAVSWAKVVLAATTGWLYWTSGTLTTDLLIGVAMFEIFHALQYYAIVWVYNCRLARRSERPTRLLAFLFQDRTAFLGLYVAAIVAFGSLRLGAQYVSEPVTQRLLMAALTASTLLHFYFDGFIWKVSQRKTQVNLGIEGNHFAPQSAAPSGLAHAGKWLALAAGAVLLFGLETGGGQTSAAEEHERLAGLAVLTPDLPELQSRVSRDALARGDMDVAISAAAKALALRPTSPQAHADLGVALLRSDDFSAAAEQFTAAIKLAPQEWQNHCDLGSALARLEQWDASEVAFRRADELHPHSAILQHAWGDACRDRGDRAGAIEHYRAALEQSPNASDIRASLVTALSAGGEHAAAIDAAREGVSLRAESAAELLSLGLALAAADRADEAIAPLERAVELSPANAQAHFQLGVIAERAGDFRRSEISFRRCIDLDPEFADAYVNLGTVLCLQHDTAHSIKAYRRALDLAPDHPLAHYNLGLLLMETGEVADAREHIGRAAELGCAVPEELARQLGL